MATTLACSFSCSKIAVPTQISTGPAGIRFKWPEDSWGTHLTCCSFAASPKPFPSHFLLLHRALASPERPLHTSPLSLAPSPYSVLQVLWPCSDGLQVLNSHCRLLSASQRPGHTCPHVLACAQHILACASLCPPSAGRAGRWLLRDLPLCPSWAANSLPSLLCPFLSFGDTQGRPYPPASKSPCCCLQLTL